MIVAGLIVVALGVLLSVSSAANRPLAGDLDPSFGSGGVVSHSFGSGESPRINAIAVQPDGKIVVAGGSTPGDHGFLLARYLPNGSPDPSFGDGGYVETHFTYWAFAQAVALQPDGKIAVVGSSWQGDYNVFSEFTLARYNPDGSLDTNFGTDGITNTVIPPRDGSEAGAAALAVLPGGAILAAGSQSIAFPQGSFVLAEYRADGSLDPTFGNGGIVQTGFSGDDALAGIAVQPNGKIVATGTSSGPGHGIYFSTMALARYKPNGSLDPTFGTAGKVTTKKKLGYLGGPPTLQDGRIVVAGFTRLNSVSNFFPVIARFRPSGRLDTTFGKHGFAKIERVSGDDVVQGAPAAVVAQSNGKLLVAAANSVLRLMPNGRLDKSFGTGGIVQLPGAGVATSALALQADGKILAGGNNGNTLQGNGNVSWILARLMGGNNCVVPYLRGKTLSKATTSLKKSYCRRGQITERFSSKVTKGRVIGITQPRDARLPGGTKVGLIVSRGMRP